MRILRLGSELHAQAPNFSLLDGFHLLTGLQQIAQDAHTHSY